MIGRVFRTTLALSLTVLTALAPVAPAYAEESGQTTQGSSQRAADTAAADSRAQVTNIQTTNTDGTAHVVIDVGAQVTYQAARLSSPDRIYFDIEGATLAPALARNPLQVENSGLVKSVRVAQNRPGVVRVVLEVNDAKDYTATLQPDPYRLVVDVKSSEAAAEPVTAAAPDASPVPATEQAPQAATNATPSPAPAPQAQAPVPSRTFQISNQDFTHGQSWFPNILMPYTPVTVPEPMLTNAPRIEQMVQDGKLSLSLQDAIDLALQNNLDLAIQQYGPWIAEANIMRTKGGGASRGAFGVTGAPSISFDPAFTATMSLDQRLATANNTLTAGVGLGLPGSTFSTVSSHTGIANIAYSQAFHTGTAFSVSANNTRLASFPSSNFFTPSVTSNMTILATQPLLKGFGLFVNEANIHVAILSKRASDLTFQQQMITSLTAVANAYWELVFARGNVNVAKATVALADKLYSDNKKQVDIGTLAPLEIVQAEAQVASANQALIVAQTTLTLDQIVLLNLINKDPNASVLRSVEVIPTDTADNAPPPVEQVPLVDAINEAITKRPDVLSSAVTLKADDISKRTSRNALLPSLTLSAQYTAQGLAGNRLVPTPPNPVVMSGLGTSLNEMFLGTYPEYNAQLTLTIPIRNRQAQADSATVLLTARQDELRYQQTLNVAANDVHNTQVALAQARVIVDAAAKTRDLDQQTLDAEQKKYQLGASTLFNIVSDQNTLASAASAEVRARVNLAQAKVNFDRAMGRTIETFNITIADSQLPHLYKDSLIPGTSTTGELIAIPNGNPGLSSTGSGQ